MRIRANNFLGIGEAFDLLERLRIRLVRRTSRKALRDAGLAYVDASSITVINYSVDQRAVSSANLDVRLAQVVTDVSDHGTGAIEKVSHKSPDEIPDVAAAPVVELDYSLVRLPD